MSRDFTTFILGLNIRIHVILCGHYIINTLYLKYERNNLRRINVIVTTSGICGWNCINVINEHISDNYTNTDNRIILYNENNRRHMGFNIVKTIVTKGDRIQHVLLTNGLSEILEIDTKETADNMCKIFSENSDSGWKYTVRETNSLPPTVK